MHFGQKTQNYPEILRGFFYSFQYYLFVHFRLTPKVARQQSSLCLTWRASWSATTRPKLQQSLERPTTKTAKRKPPKNTKLTSLRTVAPLAAGSVPMRYRYRPSVRETTRPRRYYEPSGAKVCLKRRRRASLTSAAQKRTLLCRKPLLRRRPHQPQCTD